MNTRAIRRIVLAQLALIPLMLAFLNNANASQRKQMVNGKEVVVHTNPIPVILHRLVPPQHGRHVTQKEISSGHVPQARAISPNRKRP